MLQPGWRTSSVLIMQSLIGPGKEFGPQVNDSGELLDGLGSGSNMI